MRWLVVAMRTSLLILLRPISGRYRARSPAPTRRPASHPHARAFATLADDMPAHRIVVLDDWTDFYPRVASLERLRERGEVVVFATPSRNTGETVERLRGATVAIANRERTQLQ